MSPGGYYTLLTALFFVAYNSRNLGRDVASNESAATANMIATIARVEATIAYAKTVTAHIVASTSHTSDETPHVHPFEPAATTSEKLEPFYYSEGHAPSS